VYSSARKTNDFANHGEDLAHGEGKLDRVLVLAKEKNRETREPRCKTGNNSMFFLNTIDRYHV